MTIANAWLAAKDPAEVEAGLVKLRAARDDPLRANYFRGLGETDGHFALWLALCDRVCIRMIGVGIFDIADSTWADFYADGLSPREAVRDALEADDVYAALFDTE